MARSDLKELYKELISNEFSFLPRGENILIYIYKKVQLQYPQLCDDNFFCIDNCTNGNNEPEWHHAVRRALDRLKRISKSVEKLQKRGYWKFT